MKIISLALCLVFFSVSCNAQPQETQISAKGYQIGDKAEDFQLKNVDGTMQSLSMVENANGYIVVFTSNECPFAKAYEDRLIELHDEMAPKGYPVIAINSNDGAEGGGNSFQDMVTRSQEKGFPFVYLKDEKQEVYPKYGATKTPHVFLLDKDLIVRYIGAIDDNSNSPEDVEERYVANAIAALEAGKSPDPATTKAIGCPISKSGEGGARRGPKGPPSPEKIIEMMDTNNDQQVSKSEVNGPLARDFDRLDVNNDGLLNKEELSKLLRSN
jgi:peroxiredoxin